MLASCGPWGTALLGWANPIDFSMRDHVMRNYFFN